MELPKDLFCLLFFFPPFDTDLTCYLGLREIFKKKMKNITMMMPIEIYMQNNRHSVTSSTLIYYID